MAAPPTVPGLNMGDKAKRSFEFRMSKKVAELTQVVHMLFTRNHEKEVEIEALKDAYEHEIGEVLEDARGRIAALETSRDESLRESAGEVDRVRRLLEGDFQAKEGESRRAADEAERLLAEERAETQKLRDMLIRAQRDIENLRRGASKQITSVQDESVKREREVEMLRRQVAELEANLRDVGKESADVIRDLQRGNDTLERELRQVHAALDESHRTRDQLLTRNRQLEADMKALKRDFNRKVSEVVNGQRGMMSRVGTASSMDTNEELERLRREIQRYRLELANRDSNFNRMFTDKQPIHLDRAGGHGTALRVNTSQSAGTVHSFNTSANHVSAMALKREKTVNHLPPHGPVICFEDQPAHHQAPPPTDRQRSLSTPSTKQEAQDARDSRFPSISSTPDINITKPRPAITPGRLTKPRPLPKEMLYGK